MKKKLFLLIFSLISLFGLLAFRTYLLGNCIDSFNGFFNPEYSFLRIIFAAVLAIVLIVIAITVISDKAFPGSPRRSSKVLAFANAVYGLLILADSFTYLHSLESVWEYINFFLFILLAVFMFYYAICLFTVTKASLLLSLLPLAYFVYKLCYVFINSFGIIKSSEVTLKIVALIFCVLFFEFYSRYVSNVSFKKIRKITLFTGIGACITCLIAALPDLIVPFIYSGAKMRLMPNESVFLCATAVYIAIFLLSSYSKKQLYNSYTESDAE